jgi:glycosyltransferase involved in cell wall biosynthesis
MRDLLLLSHAFPPENTAAAARPWQLYKYLPALGYRVHVVASSFDGVSNSDPQVHRVPGARESRRLRLAEKLAGGFMRRFAPYNDRLPWVPYALSAGDRLIRGRGIAAIVSTHPFLASHIAALRLKWTTGLPWIADFQDPILGNPFRNRRWPYPYDAMIEYRIFRHADRIIANTDTVAAAMRARYPQWAGKVSVLWNSFDPRERIESVPRLERSHRVLAHVGTLYGQRHPCLLLTTLERLEAKPSDIMVKLVGPIEPALLARDRPLYDRLERAGVLEYGNRLVDRAEALKETAEADYLLLLDLNDGNASLQVPSKLLDYIRYGKPILAFTPENSPTHRILTGSGIAFVAIDPRQDADTVARKLTEFLRLPAEPRPPSAWFAENFDAETQARTVACLLDGLLAPEKIVAPAAEAGQ